MRLGTELDDARRQPGRPRALPSTTAAPSRPTCCWSQSGRTPNGDRLNVGAAGIDADDHGRIVVDEFCRTSADGVYALGDVSTPVPLKHVANREADVVKHNLLHPDRLRTVNHDHVPSAVFTEPQMASVGLTEEKCRDEASRLPGRPNSRSRDIAYGWAMQDESGFCKVLVDGATGPDPRRPRHRPAGRHPDPDLRGGNRIRHHGDRSGASAVLDPPRAHRSRAERAARRPSRRMSGQEQARLRTSSSCSAPPAISPSASCSPGCTGWRRPSRLPEDYADHRIGPPLARYRRRVPRQDPRQPARTSSTTSTTKVARRPAEPA